MMRHVSRSHRVALDWLFDRINLDPKIQIKYVDTKNLLENSRKEDGRRTCGSAKPRSVCLILASLNKRQSSSCGPDVSKIPGNPQMDSGSVWGGAGNCRQKSVEGAAGNCRQDIVRNRVQNQETFSNVERRQPVWTCGKLQHCAHDHAPRLVLKSAWNEQQQQQQLRQDVFLSQRSRGKLLAGSTQCYERRELVLSPSSSSWSIKTTSTKTRSGWPRCKFWLIDCKTGIETSPSSKTWSKKA